MHVFWYNFSLILCTRANNLPLNWQQYQNSLYLKEFWLFIELFFLDFSTSYEKGLKRHKMRHTGEKPYKCSWPQCEWTFRQPTHLKAHMLKHTGEKPFICELIGCDRRFSSRQAMRFHFEKSHKCWLYFVFTLKLILSSN
jgi:hypothetical protein